MTFDPSSPVFAGWLMSFVLFFWQLSKPLKVPILERYVEEEPQEPQSPEELKERTSRVQRIRKLLTRSRYCCCCFSARIHSLVHHDLASNSISSYHQPSTQLDFSGFDSVLQQQEKMMDMSYLLASQASQKSRLVAGGLRLTVARVSHKSRMTNV